MNASSIYVSSTNNVAMLFTSRGIVFHHLCRIICHLARYGILLIPITCSVCSDSLTALNNTLSSVFSHDQHPIAEEIIKWLSLIRDRTVIFKWIPAHANIRGNNLLDTTAKRLLYDKCSCHSSASQNSYRMRSEGSMIEEVPANITNE